MQEGATAGNLQRANSRNKLWEVWCRFCAAHNSPEMLDAVEDPVPILVAFARRYRDGRLAIRGQPVLARSVEDVVRQIAKAFTDVGALDPRLNPHGRMDARLSGLWRHYRHQDPEPSRTKPIPTSVLQQASNTCKISRDPGFLCLGDMMWVAFYFLCRPGEYTADGDDSHPFRFKDVQLWLGPRRLDLKHAPPPTSSTRRAPHSPSPPRRIVCGAKSSPKASPVTSTPAPPAPSDAASFICADTVPLPVLPSVPSTRTGSGTPSRR